MRNFASDAHPLITSTPLSSPIQTTLHSRRRADHNKLIGSSFFLTADQEQAGTFTESLTISIQVSTRSTVFPDLLRALSFQRVLLLLPAQRSVSSHVLITPSSRTLLLFHCNANNSW